MNERLIVKSFGPVKDLDIIFKKVTLFIGDQGTGKSCVAKLFSTFKWLEKVLSQKKYKLSYFEQYNRFKTKLCAYHRIDSFIVNGNPYIKFEGELWRRGNSPWITPALLTKYLSTTEHEERQVADSMHLCPQPLYL